MYCKGCWKQGGRGASTPSPTFAEISPKLSQNRGFSLEFLFFAPTFGLAPPLINKLQHPCQSFLFIKFANQSLWAEMEGPG